MKRLIPAILACALAATSPCYGDITAEVNIHWDTFSVSLIPLSGGAATPVIPTWIAGEGYLEVDAFQSDPVDSDFKFLDLAGLESDPPISISTDPAVTLASATASRTTLPGPPKTTTLTASATSAKGVPPIAAGFNDAYALVENSGVFTATGDGILLITVDWDMKLEGGPGPDDFTEGLVGMGLETDPSDPFEFSGGYTEVAKNSDVHGEGPFTGTLALAFANTGTTEFGLFVFGDAYSTSTNVPEPGSLALMLCGLVGLGWIGRKRFNK